MTTKLNIEITAETAEDAMMELSMLSFRAAQELGVVPLAPTTLDDLKTEPPVPNEIPAVKGNGAELAAELAKAAKPKAKKAAAAPPKVEPKIDRETVLDGLTKLYGGGDPKVRKAITEFRDSRGAERLRDLKEEDIPEAGALLVTLKLEAETAP